MQLVSISTSGRCRRHPETRCSRSSLVKAISVLAFPRLRIRPMTSERLAFENTSLIFANHFAQDLSQEETHPFAGGFGDDEIVECSQVDHVVDLLNPRRRTAGKCASGHLGKISIGVEQQFLYDPYPCF